MLYGDLAHLGAEVYSKPLDIQSNDIGAQYSQIEKDFVIAIPGTRNLLNWLTDLRTLPDIFPYIGPFHHGFGSDIVTLAPLVRAAIPSGLRPVLVGHSLGGVVAQGVAACLAYWGHTPVVMSMGAPRGALRLNFWFSLLVKKCDPCLAFERRGDPVPHVPGPLLFSHPVVGTQIGTPVKSLDLVKNHDVDLYVQDIADAYPQSVV